MGTRERKQRDFEEREDLFLDRALDLIRRDGLLNLQMARIADKCEYAVGTLYQHFASKEDLLLALVVRSFKDYLELLNRVAAWKASSRDRMFAVGVADIVFVRRHPDYFRIAQYSLCEIAWQAASIERRQAFLDANHPLVNVVVGIVADARRAGDLDDSQVQTAQELGVGLWSVCAGYRAFTYAEGVLENFAIRDPYPLMCRHLEALLDGFRWRPVSTTPGSAELDALVARIRREVFDES